MNVQDQVNDVRRAVKFVRMNFGGSAENLVDLMQKRDGRIDPTFQFYGLDPRTGARRSLTAREEVVRMLQEYSPVTHVTAGDPPTILIHGDQDKAVPVQQSRRPIDRLNDAKVPARLVVREGVGLAYPGWEADAGLIGGWLDADLRRIR